MAKRYRLDIDGITFKSEAEASACREDLLAFFNAGGVHWQSLDVWMTVDQVYETRWDCSSVPGGARNAA
jgi:hypothetical protein